MRRTAAALALLAGILAAFLVPGGRDHAPVTSAGEGGRYIGSAACAECHGGIYDSWKKTTHALSIRDYSPDVVARPFDGDTFTARGIEQELGPGPWMTCEGPGGEVKRFRVDWVIGLRRVQMFTTRMDGGRIQVLPVFLEVPDKEWFDYADFIFGGPRDLEIPPDSPNSWYGPLRNFNSRCGRCHFTNYEIGYRPDEGSYWTHWSERNIGCETCHGPGGEHDTFHRTMLDGDDPIVNPAKLPVERANHVCGQCHAESFMVDPDFRPGDDLFAHMDVAGLEDAKHLWPDGRPKELIHSLVPTMESRCGPIACTKCHDPHGRGFAGLLYKPIENDWTCTQCHDEIAKDLEAHTHHPAESTGSRCVNCHMPPMVIEGGHGRVRDHTISIPSPENSRKHGVPNACLTCHVLEDWGWEREHFEKWWPGAEERNHRVPLADAMAAARSRDADARSSLVELLGSPNPVYRAGAAWGLVHQDHDLRPQLADPHPMVRRAAVDGVAKRDPEALFPLLEDGNAVLRRAAALALSRRHGWLRDRPEVRDRIVRVLEGLAALRPDDRYLHGALGTLHQLAGRKDRAVRAYERYLRLNPWDDRIRTEMERLR